MDERNANTVVVPQGAIDGRKNGGAAKKGSSMQGRRRQKQMFIIVMLFIPIVHWLISWGFINSSAILMAFQNRQGEWSMSNFSEVFEMLFDKSGNSTLRNAFGNSILTFFFAEFVGVPITLTVSYFIYKQIHGYKVFRVIFYFPHIISSIVIVTAFKQLVSPLGPINNLCESLGIALPAEGLLHTEGTATATIIFYTIWTGACGNILFYSAMSRIPPELIEVGRLEGLQLFKELVYVIMPLIWPTFSTTVILDLCNILNAGGPVLLFGIRDVIDKARAHTLPYWFFSKVYSGGAGGLGTYGIMSCVGLCFTAVSVPFTLFIRHLLNKVNSAEY